MKTYCCAVIMEELDRFNSWLQSFNTMGELNCSNRRSIKFVYIVFRGANNYAFHCTLVGRGAGKTIHFISSPFFIIPAIRSSHGTDFNFHSRHIRIPNNSFNTRCKNQHLSKGKIWDTLNCSYIHIKTRCVMCA